MPARDSAQRQWKEAKIFPSFSVASGEPGMGSVADSVKVPLEGGAWGTDSSDYTPQSRIQLASFSPRLNNSSTRVTAPPIPNLVQLRNEEHVVP
ncbi:uncharacterized protein UV8b_02935 [Ustilaginoidea virens]|uniref:Uncharacterized protein n=1 Tax=Ustilaginoidea virens TaxID=1159556 RepID=A0A8E5HNF3_USTVR|nr:uncharacterized protein UV8b_02935 [Ustilaginoidea virens]QUC18694.1 hypothetical protein UV8b_02935 [Ustilaginoidea virens]